MRFARFKGSMVAVAAMLLAGCAAVHAHKGAVLDAQLASSIQAGVDNKASVEKLLGRPSFAGEFTSNDWYYVARDTTQLAFRNPRVTKQTVLHIQFDQAGNVASIPARDARKEASSRISAGGPSTSSALGRFRCGA